MLVTSSGVMMFNESARMGVCMDMKGLASCLLVKKSILLCGSNLCGCSLKFCYCVS